MFTLKWAGHFLKGTLIGRPVTDERVWMEVAGELVTKNQTNKIKNCLRTNQKKLWTKSRRVTCLICHPVNLTKGLRRKWAGQWSSCWLTCDFDTNNIKY